MSTRAAQVALAEQLLGSWVKFKDKPGHGPLRVELIDFLGRVKVQGYPPWFDPHIFTVVTKTECANALLEEYLEMFPAFRSKPIGAPGSASRVQQERHISLEDRAKRLLDPNPNLEG